MTPLPTVSNASSSADGLTSFATYAIGAIAMCCRIVLNVLALHQVTGKQE